MARAITSGVLTNAAEVHELVIPHVSVWSVRRHLSAMGLHGHHRRPVTHLTPLHARRRHAWGKVHVMWDCQKWAHVLFSDETTINLWGSDGLLWCRRRPNEAYLPRNVKPKKKHGGGSLMVWGIISSQGIGPIAHINGRVNAKKYTSILSQHLLPAIRQAKLSPHTTTFQQDNASPHTAKYTRH